MSSTHEPLKHWLGSSILQVWIVDTHGIIQESFGGGLYAYGLSPGIGVGCPIGDISHRLGELATATLTGRAGITARANSLGGPFRSTPFVVVTAVRLDEENKVLGTLLLCLNIEFISKDTLDSLVERLDQLVPVAARLMEAEAHSLSTKAAEYALEAQDKDWRRKISEGLIVWFQANGAKALSAGLMVVVLALARALGILPSLLGLPLP